MTDQITNSKWESKSTLEAHIRACEPYAVLVGRHAEAPRCFVSFSIVHGSHVVEVGVIASLKLDFTPAVILVDQGRRVIVGHDGWITWVELGKPVIEASLQFLGIFYQFLRFDDDVIVIHEIGALRVGAREGIVKWMISTDDILIHWHLDQDRNLVLTMMEDGHVVVVSADSGKLVL